MRTLTLYRHAKSTWEDLSLDDMDREINQRGEKAAKAMGAYMAEQNISPNIVLCSSAKRTRQTLELTQPFFATEPTTLFEDKLYLAEPEDLMSEIEKTDNSHEHVMVLAHNPGLHILALSLTPKEDKNSRDLLKENFPTAAIAVFDFDDLNAWSDIQNQKSKLRLYMRPKALGAEFSDQTD